MKLACPRSTSCGTTPTTKNFDSRGPIRPYLPPVIRWRFPRRRPGRFDNHSTRRQHRLVVELPLPILKVRLAQPNAVPYAKERCTAEFDGKRHDLVTSGDGELELELGPDTRRVELAYAGHQVQIEVAHLQPVERSEGITARLTNLGYIHGDEDRYALRSAIEEFQCDEGLEVDGDPGPKTQRALVEAHGA